MDEKNEAQFKFRWPLVITLALVFGGIIIYRSSYTLSPIQADTAETIGRSLVIPAETKVEEVALSNPEPKQALATPDVSEMAPRIEAICISGSGKSSIFVQGNSAYEGDVVDGFRILKIYPDKVEFEKDGKTITAVFPHH